MAKAEMVAARESSRWENGRWRYGTKVHIRRSLVALQNFIYVNTACDTQKVVKF